MVPTMCNNRYIYCFIRILFLHIGPQFFNASVNPTLPPTATNSGLRTEGALKTVRRNGVDVCTANMNANNKHSEPKGTCTWKGRSAQHIPQILFQYVLGDLECWTNLLLSFGFFYISTCLAALTCPWQNTSGSLDWRRRQKIKSITNYSLDYLFNFFVYDFTWQHAWQSHSSFSHDHQQWNFCQGGLRPMIYLVQMSSSSISHTTAAPTLCICAPVVLQYAGEHQGIASVGWGGRHATTAKGQWPRTQLPVCKKVQPKHLVVLDT